MFRTRLATNVMEDIRNLVFKHLHKTIRSTKVKNTISFNVHAVWSGLKPAYLVDENISIEKCLPQFTNLLNDLRAHQQNSPHHATHLQIIRVKDDYFLMNTHECVKSAPDATRTFVDISDSLEQPTIIDQKSSDTGWMSIQAMVENVVSQIYNFLHSPVCTDTNEHRFQQTLKLKSEWNVCTLFGVLLDYPVVYWYTEEVGPVQ